MQKIMVRLMELYDWPLMIEKNLVKRLTTEYKEKGVIVSDLEGTTPNQVELRNPEKEFMLKSQLSHRKRSLEDCITRELL